MTDKAIVRPPREASAFDLDDATKAAAGALDIEHVTPGGAIVAGSRDSLDALAAAGARVKILPDTNLIRIYDVAIDIEADDVLADVPTRTRVPRAHRGDCHTTACISMALRSRFGSRRSRPAAST